ncbi:MAG: ATP-binding protein [Actinomycetota bacterium]
MSQVRDFEPEPGSAWEVRRFVEEALAGVSRLEDIVLIASELAANVIRHARTEFSVRIRREGEIVRLEVSDGSSVVPAMEELTESTRGLRMVETISERWGIEPSPGGKTVWAEVAAPTGD